MTVTSEDRPGQRRPRRVALAAAGALTFAGLGLVNAAPASAEVLNATGGSLQWGLKSSLLSYHIGLHAGTTQGVAMGDGVTASSTTRGSGAETYPAFWNFPFVSGSYDSTTNSYTAQYGGFIALTESNPAISTGPGSASPFKNFKISNPAVVIDLTNGTKKLVVDVDEGDDGDPATPVDPPVNDVDFATFSSLTTPVTPSGGTVTYTNLAAALTAAGSSAFGGFYGEGVEVDPVTTSLTGLTGGGDPDPCIANPSAPGCDPDPEPGSNQQTISFTVPNVQCAGEVTWAIAGDSAVTMAEAAVNGTKLSSTGAIDPITVTDSRTGNGQDCYDVFDVSGQVSNFTGSAGTIPGSYLGWSPTADGTGLTAGPVVPAGFEPTGPGLSQSSLLVSTAQGQAGAGEAGANLALDMPVNTPPGSYQSTLTLTGLS